MRTFGCDPEVFITYNNNGKDYVASPAKLFKDKVINFTDMDVDNGHKHPIILSKDGKYNWMMDGVAVELTTKVPAVTAQQLYLTLQEALDDLRNYVSKLKWDYPLNVKVTPTVNIDIDMYLKNLEDPMIYQGFIFGCDPDQDCFEKEYVCKTHDVTKYPYRHGGGHWHIGSTDKSEIEFMHMFIIPFIQLQAITVGNTCFGRSDLYELEVPRLDSYGSPGRFRSQKWGTEYRSPSNNWITNLETIELMIYGSHLAFEYLKDPKVGREVLNDFQDLTVAAFKDKNQIVSRDISKELIKW